MGGVGAVVDSGGEGVVVKTSPKDEEDIDSDKDRKLQQT
jgi:hypothetical protein